MRAVMDVPASNPELECQTRMHDPKLFALPSPYHVDVLSVQLRRPLGEERVGENGSHYASQDDIGGAAHNVSVNHSSVSGQTLTIAVRALLHCI